MIYRSVFHLRCMLLDKIIICPNYFCRIACSNRVIRNIPCYHRASTYHNTIPDTYIRQNNGSVPNKHFIANRYFAYFTNTKRYLRTAVMCENFHTC